MAFLQTILLQANQEATKVAELSLFELLKEGGLLMIPIAICSIIMCVVFIERFLYIKSLAKLDPNFSNKVKEQLENDNKIAILGDMFELGEDSLSEHKAIIDLVIKNNSVTTYFIGKDFYSNKIQNGKCNFFLTFEDFSKHITESKFKNSLILIKGSRGMALERTLNLLS